MMCVAASCVWLRIFFIETLAVLGPIGQRHIARAQEFVVEPECGVQIVGCVSAFREFQIIPQQLSVHGVCAVFYNGLGTLDGRFAAQVGYTLLCGEYHYRVLAMVYVRYHGYNGAYLAAFCY